MDEEDHLAHGELVEREANLDDQSEQAKVKQLLRESCGCEQGPHETRASLLGQS